MINWKRSEVWGKGPSSESLSDFLGAKCRGKGLMPEGLGDVHGAWAFVLFRVLVDKVGGLGASMLFMVLLEIV